MKPLDIACIVDDDKMFSYILSKQMDIINFSKTVLIFANGLEAMRYLKPLVESPDALPDVILLDLNMPVLDGWQFLDEFVQLTPAKKITVYIVSSSIDANDHERVLQYSAVSHFYIKPITQDDLIDMLKKIDSSRS